MLSSRLRSSLFVLFGLSLYACAGLLFPSKALADTFEVSEVSPQFIIDDDGDWTSGVTTGRTLSEMNMLVMSGSGSGSSSGTYQTPNISGTITVPTASGGGANGGTWYWYTNDYNNQNYSKNFSSTDRVSFNGAQSGYDSVFIWPTSSLSASTEYVGLRYYQSNDGNYFLRKDQRLRIVHPSRTIGKMDDELGTNFSVSGRQLNNWKVYAVVSSSPTICTVDDDGCYVIPKNCTAIWLVCEFAYTSGNYFVVDAPKIWLIDDTTANAIKQQTQDLMSTDGSNGLVNDTVSQTTSQLRNVSIYEFVTDFNDTLVEGMISQDVDGTFSFPGMSLAGFSLPSVSVRPMELIPSNLQNMVRTFFTFLICAACLRNFVETVQLIFGIQDVSNGLSVYERPDESVGLEEYW